MHSLQAVPKGAPQFHKFDKPVFAAFGNNFFRWLRAIYRSTHGNNGAPSLPELNGLHTLTPDIPTTAPSTHAPDTSKSNAPGTSKSKKQKKRRSHRPVDKDLESSSSEDEGYSGADDSIDDNDNPGAQREGSDDETREDEEEDPNAEVKRLLQHPFESLSYENQRKVRMYQNDLILKELGLDQATNKLFEKESSASNACGEKLEKWRVEGVVRQSTRLMTDVRVFLFSPHLNSLC